MNTCTERPVNHCPGLKVSRFGASDGKLELIRNNDVVHSGDEAVANDTRHEAASTRCEAAAEDMRLEAATTGHDAAANDTWHKEFVKDSARSCPKRYVAQAARTNRREAAANIRGTKV